MIRTILHRLFLMCLILIGVMTVTFILSRVLPGSPVELMLGAKPTAQQIAEAEVALGLNKPLYQQYFIFLGNALQGDFGTSLITGQPVTEDVFLRVTATFELVTIALLLALSAGIPLGIKAAVKRTALDPACGLDLLLQWHWAYLADSIRRQARMVAATGPYR